jgi:hypothetical protein
MNSQANPSPAPGHPIEIKVAEVHRLFNSMDPSPFRERDLDHEAEQFIVSWAQEISSREPLKLVVHLGVAPEGVADVRTLIAESMKHYFEYRAEMTQREFRQLMKEGRTALVIGLGFLAACELVAQGLPATQDTWHGILRHGLTIIGWVAMWRPLEIYLYRWWPLRRLENVYRNLSAMTVEVRTAGCHD